MNSNNQAGLVYLEIATATTAVVRVMATTGVYQAYSANLDNWALTSTGMTNELLNVATNAPNLAKTNSPTIHTPNLLSATLLNSTLFSNANGNSLILNNTMGVRGIVSASSNVNANRIVVTNNVRYLDAVPAIANNTVGTNWYAVDCNFAQRTFTATNQMRFTNVANTVANTRAFPCFTVSNGTATTLGIWFPTYFKRLGGFPNNTNVTAGKTARIAFEVSGDTNVVLVGIATD